MSRIQLTDNTISVVTKMSEGNPGAITVLMQILQEGSKIDPDDFMGGLGAILGLDTLEIYGSSIWILYKYICRESIPKTMALLRAHQLGFISGKELSNAANEQSYKERQYINADELYQKVKDRLPNFHNN